MLTMVAMKLPPTFTLLGPRRGVVLDSCAEKRTIVRSPTSLDDTEAWLSQYIDGRYSPAFQHRVHEAVVWAVAFVLKNTHTDNPVWLVLTQFMNEGERCVSVVLDGLPWPNAMLQIPMSSESWLAEPDMRTLTGYQHGWLTHAMILHHVDGYGIHHVRGTVLQLNMTWYE